MQQRVAALLGGFANPHALHRQRTAENAFGKLLRRSLQALAEDRDPGDLSTLDDPKALDEIRSALLRGPDLGVPRCHAVMREIFTAKYPAKYLFLRE